MNINHFLSTLFLKKNKKGQYRQVTIRQPNLFAWQASGKRRSPVQTYTFCGHCGIPMPARPHTVSATCSNCRERSRIAALSLPE